MSLIASSQLTIIIGLGMTGMSAARFLQKRNIRFMVMDSRKTPPNLEQFRQEFPEVNLMIGGLDEDLLQQAEEIIISPGMDPKTPALQPAMQQGISSICDIELFARYVDKPVIAITGSNAKSTVTTMVGDMAKASGFKTAVGGNLGVAVLELIDSDDIDLFVLELSSFQLETMTSLKPKVATVLNVSHDHMDRYDSFAHYHQTKQRIYRNAENIVVNRQDLLTHPPLSNNVAVWSFGSDKPDIKGFGLVEKDNTVYLAYQFNTLIATDELPLKGKHNFINALSALAIGCAAGFELDTMLEALAQFKGLPHRCEYVATVDQVTYINDSKATNVGATLAALEGFSDTAKNIILIAGGDGKGADFSPLISAVEQTVRLVVVIGQDAQKITDTLDKVTRVRQEQTLCSAVQYAKQQAEKNDIVLLSPACSSLDMFANFEERGRQFAQAVQELAA